MNHYAPQYETRDLSYDATFLQIYFISVVDGQPTKMTNEKVER